MIESCSESRPGRVQGHIRGHLPPQERGDRLGQGLTDRIQSDPGRKSSAWSVGAPEGPKTKVFDSELGRTSGSAGEVLAIEEDGFVVGAGSGSVKIRRVQPPECRKMPAPEYIELSGLAVRGESVADCAGRHRVLHCQYCGHVSAAKQPVALLQVHVHRRDAGEGHVG